MSPCGQPEAFRTKADCSVETGASTFMRGIALFVMTNLGYHRQFAPSLSRKSFKFHKLLIFHVFLAVRGFAFSS